MSSESDHSGRVKPDIVAPGVDVYSSLPGGTYGENSGTSMAGPHVVGVVALMWAANPKLVGDIDRTGQILRETAQRVNVSDEKIVCGDPNATPINPRSVLDKPVWMDLVRSFTLESLLCEP